MLQARSTFHWRDSIAEDWILPGILLQSLIPDGILVDNPSAVEKIFLGIVLFSGSRGNLKAGGDTITAYPSDK